MYTLTSPIVSVKALKDNDNRSRNCGGGISVYPLNANVNVNSLSEACMGRRENIEVNHMVTFNTSNHG